MPRAGLFALAVVLGACRTQPVGQALSSIAPAAVFGPVIGADVIAGREDEGDDVVLLAGGVAIVRVNLAARRFSRVKLRIAFGEECWNLARLSDGSLWTLKGHHTLAQIGADGALVRERSLPDAHFGLFAAGDRLLFQRADFTPPAPALLDGTPDAPSRTPWSAIATRRFPSLARASVAALNMVTCGPAEGAERACWFPDEAAVSLVNRQGVTRWVPLSGLDVVPPETLLTSDTPARPVRDAYVGADGDIWVLSSGKAPPGASDVAGGWVLARYRSSGALHSLVRLREAVRLILRVTKRSIVVLTSTGMVAEVPRW